MLISMYLHLSPMHTMHHSRLIQSPLLLAHLMSGLLLIHATFKKSHDIKDGDTGETGSCLFICRNKNSRNCSLDSKKAIEDNFISKLSLLLDNVNYINKLCVIPTTVCRNCYSKITNVHDYLQDIRNCTSKYLEEGSVRVKRCAFSPLTPKTPNPVASKDISGVNSKSRKQLKL